MSEGCPAEEGCSLSVVACVSLLLLSVKTNKNREKQVIYTDKKPFFSSTMTYMHNMDGTINISRMNCAPNSNYFFLYSF